eukprot:8273488-Alexandrium_andersonii.AAC.1
MSCETSRVQRFSDFVNSNLLCGELRPGAVVATCRMRPQWVRRTSCFTPCPHVGHLSRGSCCPHAWQA